MRIIHLRECCSHTLLKLIAGLLPIEIKAMSRIEKNRKIKFHLLQPT